MKLEVGQSHIVDALGNQLSEPPKLDPQRAAYVRAFYPQLMQGFPAEGRDLMLEVGRIQDIARTREVLDHLAWLFVNETGGYVLRGDKVEQGKQHLFAIFKLKTDLPPDHQPKETIQ